MLRPVTTTSHSVDSLNSVNMNGVNHLFIIIVMSLSVTTMASSQWRRETMQLNGRVNPTDAMFFNALMKLGQYIGCNAMEQMKFARMTDVL